MLLHTEEVMFANLSGVYITAVASLASAAFPPEGVTYTSLSLEPHSRCFA